MDGCEPAVSTQEVVNLLSRHALRIEVHNLTLEGWPESQAAIVIASSPGRGRPASEETEDDGEVGRGPEGTSCRLSPSQSAVSTPADDLGVTTGSFFTASEAGGVQRTPSHGIDESAQSCSGSLSARNGARSGTSRYSCSRCEDLSEGRERDPNLGQHGSCGGDGVAVDDSRCSAVTDVMGPLVGPAETADTQTCECPYAFEQLPTRQERAVMEW